MIDPHQVLATRADAARLQLEVAEAAGDEAEAALHRSTLAAIDAEARSLNAVKQQKIVGVGPLPPRNANG